MSSSTASGAAAPTTLALIGLGKIARDQHLPALRANAAFEVVAGADPYGGVEGLAYFQRAEDMLRELPQIQAVALCTPPQLRYQLAHMALQAGKHVLLEKPPCATLSELAELQTLAQERGVSLFTAWHSRYAPAVEAAREWLKTRTLTHVEIQWKEDVRRWHPGQLWIWRAGGLGVFDPGINALSVLTRILPQAVHVRRALLDFPGNCQTPIAAELDLYSGATPIRAEFDFLQTGPQTWDISVTSTQGEVLLLTNGGRTLTLDGRQLSDAPDCEYPMLYAHFAELIAQRASSVDDRPLRLTADALLVGERRTVEDFNE